MFKSNSLCIHVLRGVSGIGLFVLALSARLPVWAVIACLVSGLVLLRGCPMCWAVGLIETVRDKTGAARASGQSCRVPVQSVRPPPRAADAILSVPICPFPRLNQTSSVSSPMKNMIRPFVLLLALLGAVASLTAAEPATVTRAKATVVVILADWCPACKSLEPGMARLVRKYSNRLAFVVFDLTSAETRAHSLAKAKSLGLVDLLLQNVDQGTPCVAIVSRRGKEVFRQVGGTDLALYDKAFAQAATPNLIVRCYRWVTGS